jgi:hypothetical protein
MKAAPRAVISFMQVFFAVSCITHASAPGVRADERMVRSMLWFDEEKVKSATPRLAAARLTRLRAQRMRRSEP